MTSRIVFQWMLIIGALACVSCSRSQFDPANSSVATTNDSGDHPGEERSPLVGKLAPDIEGELLDGTKFSLKEQYANNIVLLDFWATWCGPCIEELPVLMKIAEEYKDKGVALYAVNQQDDPKVIAEFLENKGWKLNVVLDPESKHGDAYVVSGIPQLAIIGRNGIVQKVHVGYAPEIEQILRRELDSLLKSAAKSDGDQ